MHGDAVRLVEDQEIVVLRHDASGPIDRGHVEALRMRVNAQDGALRQQFIPAQPLAVQDRIDAAEMEELLASGKDELSRPSYGHSHIDARC